MQNMTEMNGEIPFGSPDASRYIGNIAYVNVTLTRPYSSYWGIDIDSLAYDGPINRTVLNSATSAIIDTVRTTLQYSYNLLKFGRKTQH